MDIRRNPESGRRAVSLLAAAFMILIGAVATAFTVLSATDRTSWKDWVVWGLLFGGVILLIRSLCMTPDKERTWTRLALWLDARDRTDPLADYQFKKRRRQAEQRLGTNSPPTLESVREAAESSVRWVPRGSVPNRPPRPRRK